MFLDVFILKSIKEKWNKGSVDFFNEFYGWQAGTRWSYVFNRNKHASI